MLSVDKSKKWYRILVVCVLVYHFALAYAFMTITGVTELYTLNPNIYKFANGLMWIVVLLVCIPNDMKKSSTFFLLLRLMLEIIPMTVIYYCCNQNAVYYNVVCLGMLMCECILCSGAEIKIGRTAFRMSRELYLGTIGVVVAVLVIIFIQNGLPSLTALNIYNVYKLRAEKGFVLNKYVGYILRMIVVFGIPFLLTRALEQKKKIYALIYCGLLGIVYLYTGMKSYLFALPLILVCAIGANVKNFCCKIYSLFSVGIVGLVMLSPHIGIVSKVYSLIVRRVIFEPSNLKFCYYEYFSVHPKMGMGGILPTWIIPNPYGANIGHIISDYFWGTPEINNNTGVLGEAYARFGFCGIVLFWLIYTFLLMGIDRLQNRTSYAFALGVFVFAIYSLTEAYLFSNLIFGEWLLGIIILLFYGKHFQILKLKKSK